MNQVAGSGGGGAGASNFRKHPKLKLKGKKANQSNFGPTHREGVVVIDLNEVSHLDVYTQ